MNRVESGSNNVGVPSIEEHPKKKIIVALIVVAGVAATVSVVALAVLIPPVGAAVGAALIAIAIKISIGAGVGSVLLGGAAYLIHKFNKPKDPKNPSKSETDSDDKPSILAKPLVARPLESNAMADFQAIRKNALRRVEQRHKPDAKNNIGKKLDLDPATSVDVRELHRIEQTHQPDRQNNIGNRRDIAPAESVDVKELHRIEQTRQPDRKNNLGKKQDFVPAASVDIKELHRIEQTRQPDGKNNLGKKQDFVPATSVDIKELHRIEQTHQPDSKRNIGNRRDIAAVASVDVKEWHKNEQKHHPDTTVNLGNQLGHQRRYEPADAVLEPSIAIPAALGSPIQNSRTPSPIQDEVEKINNLLITQIEKNQPVNVHTSFIGEPMPHIGKDLTDEIPVSLLQKIVSDENVPMENTLPPSGNVIEEPKKNLIGTFEVIDCKFDGPLELNSYLNCGTIDDNTPVAFHNGKLVARDSVDDLVDPKSALLAILKANFRSELVDDLIKTFRFETRRDFTAADFKRIVVTLLASLHDKDMRMLFNTVKGIAKAEDKIGCVSLLTEEEKTYLMTFNSFDEVDQKGRKILIGTYYKLAVFDLNKVVPTSPEMLADLEVVQAFHSILPQLRRKEQEKLSRAEYLAKTLAYLELQVGQIVKVPKNAEEEDLYIVVEHLDHKEHKDETQAVICRILVPYQKDKSDAIILVRGTQTGSQVAALNSLIRDADYEGVGKGSFDRAAPDIFKMIERAVSNLSGDVKLEIQGHSLAGVDAQRVMHLIISKMCAGSLASVKKIFHFSHNPPGVSQAEADDFNKKVDALDSDIDLEMNFITFSGDLISWFGSIYNGAKRKDNRIKGSFYHAVTKRYLLAAHTCVSTKNDLELAKEGETITDKNVFYEIYDLQSDTAKKYLLKSYASKFAAFHVWRRYIVKYTVHKFAFDFVVRAFGRVERKLEDRVKNIMA